MPSNISAINLHTTKRVYRLVSNFGGITRYELELVGDHTEVNIKPLVQEW